jgi:hypothetical protein
MSNVLVRDYINILEGSGRVYSTVARRYPGANGF